MPLLTLRSLSGPARSIQCPTLSNRLVTVIFPTTRTQLNNYKQTYSGRLLANRFAASMAPTPNPTAIVISGPSGAGKSTILQRLFEEYPDKFGFSVSHTTRGPRGSEQHGKEYYFVTEQEFVDLIEKGGFVEHAKFGDNRYGTSIMAIESIAEKGRTCILDIEMEVCISFHQWLYL
jgi:hypothetical protein